MKFFEVLLFMSLLHLIVSQELSPVVTTNEGQVQGNVKYTFEGIQFYAFQGIPFGKPPVGSLRFQAPEPAEPWSDVLQVTSDPPICMQPSYIITHPTIGKEDCLQLNVYTPKLPTNESNPSLPVHVFIHGGGFTNGDNTYDSYNPERYMNLNVVLVTIKYRLGPLGFLATNDEAASGNAGLLDQSLALKWVQINIAAFGGNPNDVTLSGQSAGGSSVIYQYISPMSAGLFRRAISESGTALNPWAIQRDPLYYANAMGEYMNCSTENTTELIVCLQESNVEDIVAHSLSMMIDNITIVFAPTVETSPSGQFLTEDPLTMLEEGNFNHVPLQLGFNRDEGCAIYTYTFFLFLNVTETTFDETIPDILYFLTGYRSNLVNVSYAIKDHYYTGIDYTNQTEVNIITIKWISDFLDSSIVQTAVLVSSHDVPTYLYVYNYVSNTSLTNFTGEPDVLHGDELKYLFYTPINNTKDVEFGNRFLNLWVEFIQTGIHEKPVGNDDQWLPTPPGQYNFYDINEQFIMRGNYDTADMEFWWYTVPDIVYA